MQFFVQAVAALLAIANPVGAVPLFLTLTEEMPVPDQRRSARRAAMFVFGILAGATVTGGWVLQAFGISFAAFRAGGGLVIVLMGLEMLAGRPTRVQHGERLKEVTSESILVPFAMPLIAGPGAITTVVTLTAREPGWPGRFLVIAAVAVISITLLVTLYLAGRIRGRISQRGHALVIRFMGLILVSIGMQALLGGVREFFSG